MSGNYPPLGYDDESVMPKQRLKFLLGKLNTELTTIQQVFQQYLPGQFHMSLKSAKEFSSLRMSAAELGSEYSFLVEKLISNYEQFSSAPDQKRLEQVFSDVKSLQLLLVG
jgi:hypothetical protein